MAIFFWGGISLILEFILVCCGFAVILGLIMWLSLGPVCVMFVWNDHGNIWGSLTLFAWIVSLSVWRLIEKTNDPEP